MAKEKQAAAKSKEKKTKKKNRNADAPIHQAMPIVLVALCAFFGICIYTDVPMGAFGDFFHSVVYGLFGGAARLFPFAFLLGAIRWRRDAERGQLGLKSGATALCLLFIAVLFFLFGLSEEETTAFGSFWQMGKEGHGGGFLGNYVGYALHYCLSTAGTLILTILLFLLYLIFFFDFNPKKAFLQASAYVRQKAELRAERRRVQEEEARAEEAEQKKKEERAEDVFYNAGTALVPGAADDGTHVKRNFYDQATDGVAVPQQIRSYDAYADDDAAFFRDDEEDSSVTPVTGSSVSDPVPVSDMPVSPAREENTASGTDTGTIDVPFPLVRVSEEEDVFASDAPAEETKAPEVSEMPVAPATPETPEPEAIPTPVFVPLDNGTSDENDEEEEEDEEETGGSAAAIPMEIVEDEPFGMVAEEPVRTAFDAVEDDDTDEAASAPAVAPAGASEATANGEFEIKKAHVITHTGGETVAEQTAPAEDTFFYSFPPLSLLHEEDEVNKEDSDQEIKEKAKRLTETLESFNVVANIICATRGPRLTRYELVPGKGVRIRSIETLVDEIAMNLEAPSVRIEAPIPGKAAVGVEVPNTLSSTVRLRGLLDTDEFRNSPGKTTVCLGVDVVGVPVFADLEKMPHLLVAGATGMGKSVCINSILISLLYKARPDEVKLILIDPKKVEFKSYSNIPHLLVPVVTDAQKAAGALSWAVNEMERRYDLIESIGVRNIKAYNKTLAEHPEREDLPYIVIVIDELHDLMIQAKDIVEDSIARIAAKARAAGILLIIGTQRPSVNVITGVIKANIPSRIAFHVASQIDSRTILDTVGAEKLLNNGDMLFLSPGMKMMVPKRIQGAFLDDDEVNCVAEYLRTHSSAVHYDNSILEDMERESEKLDKDKKGADDMGFSGEGSGEGNEEDLFYHAIEIAIENNKISTSLLQRRLSIGFGKAARMIDRMQDLGIVSEPNGQKPRDVLITMEEYRNMRMRNSD